MTFCLGATTYPYLWRCSLQKALADIERQGFVFTELMVTPPHVNTALGASEAILLRQLLAQHSLNVLSLNLSGLDFNLASPWSDVRSLSQREYLRLIDLAVELEVPYVVVIPGKRHPLVPAPWEQVCDWAVEGITVIANHAKLYGVKLLIENLPFAFLETMKQVIAFVKQLRHPQVAILFDTANAHLIEDEVKAVSMAVELIALVHLSDTTRKQWCHDVPGTGDVAFKDITTALRAASYQGDAVLELTPPNPHTAFSASANALKALGWRKAP